MPPLDPRQRSSSATAPPDQLPVVFYPHSEQVQAGRRLIAPPVQAALELIVAFEHSPMVGLADLQRIDASATDVLVVTTGQGSEVTFGLGDIEQQLRRWHEVFTAAQQQNKAIGTLDLAVSNNNPARWLEASAVPLATPKLPKPIRAKKKHV